MRKMSSKATNLLQPRASRIKQKLENALEASILELDDVSYKHAGHAGVKDGANETHFNLKVVSSKFDGQNLVKRHRMIYDLLSDELQSGLHAISIVAKTPKEVGVLVDALAVLLILFICGRRMATSNAGFLLGTRQTIMETKDGGITWIGRSIPSAEDEDFNYRFNSISFKGKEGWIVGKPAILLYTSDAGENWERIPLSASLPGDMIYIKVTGEKCAEMVTDEGAIYMTSNRGYNWKAAVQETVSATLNRTVSSGISGASYYTGSFNTVNRSPDGSYVAVSSRGNFYLTWEPGQPYWQPHNRTIARRIQNMGWRADGGLWLLVRGGGLYLSKGTGISEDFDEVQVQSRGFGILDVGYRTQDEAWAAGGSGALLRSTNGGKTWARQKAAESIAANLYSVKFLNNEKGFVLGNDGVLLRYLG